MMTMMVYISKSLELREKTRFVASHELLLGAAVLLIRVALFGVGVTRGNETRSVGFPPGRSGRESFADPPRREKNGGESDESSSRSESWARTNSFTHPL